MHWYWLHCALTLSNCNHTVIQSHQHTLDLKWQWICRPEAHGHGWVNHAAMTHLCHDAAPRTALPLIYYTGHGRCHRMLFHRVYFMFHVTRQPIQDGYLVSSHAYVVDDINSKDLLCHVCSATYDLYRST